MLNKYYIGGTYTFELALTLTAHSGVVTPTAAQVFLNLVNPSGTVSTYGVTLDAGIYYFTTTVGVFTVAGDWAYFWSVNTGTIILPATDPVPFKVRAVPA